MKGRRLGAASAGLFAATMVANLCAVAYHRILSDRLGPAYAQLYALIAVVSVLSNLTLGLNTWLVKAFSADAEAGGPGAVKGRLSALSRPGALILALATVLLLALAPLAAGYLKLPALAPALTVAVVVTMGVALLTLRSTQQGLHHFGWLGVSVASEGVARVAGAAFIGLGVEGGLLAFVLGQAAGCVCAAGGLLGLGAASPPPPYDGGIKRGLAEGGSDTLALTLFALLCYLDVVVLKHYYSDERAGLYSRAALVAKSFLYLPSALSMVLLAAAAREQAGGRDARGLLTRFLGAALALDVLGFAVVWLGTPFCLGLLAGSDPAFRTAAMLTLTRCFSLAVIPLGLLQMVVVYLLAVRRRGVVLGLALLALVYLALLRSVWGSELAVVASLGACSLVGLAGGLWMALATPTSLGAKPSVTA